MVHLRSRLLVGAGLAIAVAASLLEAQTPDIQIQGPVGKLLGQLKAPDMPPGTSGLPSTTANRLTLPTDPVSRRRLEAARDYVKSREWPEAIRLLQSLLNRRADSFVKVGAGRDGETVWRSTRDETEHLLARLPADGLRFYQLAHGPPAERMLQEALKGATSTNWRRLSAVIGSRRPAAQRLPRWQHTTSTAAGTSWRHCAISACSNSLARRSSRQ